MDDVVSWSRRARWISASRSSGSSRTDSTLAAAEPIGGRPPRRRSISSTLLELAVVASPHGAEEALVALHPGPGETPVITCAAGDFGERDAGDRARPLA